MGPAYRRVLALGSTREISERAICDQLRPARRDLPQLDHFSADPSNPLDPRADALPAGSPATIEHQLDKNLNRRSTV